MTHPSTHVIVIGGGISGLVAFRDLARAGVSATLVDPVAPGGKLRTTPFAGGALDEAADAFLARVPGAPELCRELGLEADLVAPAARRAYVWSHGELRALPEGQVLGVPTDLDELAASGIVSAAGVERARQDLTDPMVAPSGDVSIGAFMRDRLGDEVAERLIDPLVGGINAGDTDQLSLDATVPQLAMAAHSGAPSLIEACRAQRAAIGDSSAPMFLAPKGGMGALATAVLDDALAHGGEVVTGRAVGIEREGAAWRVVLEDGQAVTGSGVLVATPAGPAAGLVRPLAPHAADLLGGIPYASVAMVSIAVDRAGIDRELDGTGLIVPRVENRLVTACSWTSAKWAHLGDERTAWLRASVGRDGDDLANTITDDALIKAVLADLADLMALRGEPSEVRIVRWPDSLPQYRPGHLDRIAAIEADLEQAAPTLAISGAAFRGLGVPACIRQGRAVAAKLLGALDGPR
jgi:oxygen-dependent protoporphyrinogen oxidase